MTSGLGRFSSLPPPKIEVNARNCATELMTPAIAAATERR